MGTAYNGRASAEAGGVAPALHKLGRLAGLEPGDVALLQSLRSIDRFGPGRTIRTAGEPNPRPRFVASGWAARQKLLRDGRRQILGIVAPGDLTGVCEYDGAGAMTSTVALTAVETVDFASLFVARELVRGSPALAAAIAAAVALEHWLAVEQIVRLGRRTALERSAHFLLEMDLRLSLAGVAEPGRFPLPITQEAMSDVLGLSIVHINRTFLQLRREKWIDLRNRTVEILKPDQLIAAADFQPPPMLSPVPRHAY